MGNTLFNLYHMFDNDPPLSEDAKRWLSGDLTEWQREYKKEIEKKTEL